MSQETWGLRVLEVCKAPQDHPENQDAGDELAVMEREECLGRQGPRATEVSMAWLDFLGRRAIGVNLVLQVPQGPQVKMERGVMTEKLAPEVSLGNLDPVVCWDPKGLRDPLDLQA